MSSSELNREELNQEELNSRELNTEPDFFSSEEMTDLGEHLEALRHLLIKSGLSIAFFCLISAIFYTQLLNFAVKPFEETLSKINATEKNALITYSFVNTDIQPLTFSYPENALFVEKERPILVQPGERLTWQEESPANITSRLTLLAPLEGFSIAIKLCLWSAIIASSPLWIYFCFEFIAPALLPDEKKLVLPLICCSLVAVLFGLIFAYGLILPLANTFFWHFNQAIGQNLWSLESYIDYTFVLSAGSAAAFEIGALLLFAVHFKWIGSDLLTTHRKKAMVLAFILGAILTPPDILTQLLVAIPLILLYEGCILYSKFRTSA